MGIFNPVFHNMPILLCPLPQPDNSSVRVLHKNLSFLLFSRRNAAQPGSVPIHSPREIQDICSVITKKYRYRDTSLFVMQCAEYTILCHFIVLHTTGTTYIRIILEIKNERNKEKQIENKHQKVPCPPEGGI